MNLLKHCSQWNAIGGCSAQDDNAHICQCVCNFNYIIVFLCVKVFLDLFYKQELSQRAFFFFRQVSVVTNRLAKNPAHVVYLLLGVSH